MSSRKTRSSVSKKTDQGGKAQTDQDDSGLSDRHLPTGFRDRFSFQATNGAPRPRSQRLASDQQSQLCVFMPQPKAASPSNGFAKHSKGARPQRSRMTPDHTVADGSDSHSSDNQSTQKATKKRKRPARRLYDDPSATQYPAHEYPPVPDHLYPTDPNRRLDLLICGLNPGLMSSQHAAHFRHPSNHFYRTLLLGGLTPDRVDPCKCEEMLDQQEPWPSIGLTNICIRPTAEGGELGRSDYMKGTPILERKVRQDARPRLMVFTGKGIGEWWEKCCLEKGALTRKTVKHSNKRGRKHASHSTTVKPEVDTSITLIDPAAQKDTKKPAEEVPSSRHSRSISFPVPRSLPWAEDESSGLGILPYVIQLERSTPVLQTKDATVKQEDLDVGLPKKEFPTEFWTKVEKGTGAAAEPSPGERAGYCFIFVTTSPSGRVTTMHLPEKGHWMNKARKVLDWLKIDEVHDKADTVLRPFEIIDSTKM